jgi:hypothetical protein
MYRKRNLSTPYNSDGDGDDTNDDQIHRSQKRITLLNAADRLLKTVLGTPVESSPESIVLPPPPPQSSYNLNEPRFLRGITSSNLLQKEDSIYQSLCNLNNCLFELKRNKRYNIRDLADRLLGKEAEKAIHFVFRDLRDIGNPVRCIDSEKGKYLEMKNMLHAFAKLMRDAYHHLGDNPKLGLTPLNTMQYLLDESKPTAELIPKCLRFIHFYMMDEHEFWFGRYFTSLEPIFLPQREAVAASVPLQKTIFDLYLRKVDTNTNACADDEFEYVRLKFDVGLSFENLLVSISHDMDLRLFSIQGLSKKNKKFSIRGVEDLSDDLIILVKPQNQDLEGAIKKWMKEFDSLKFDIPDYENAIVKMEENGLFDDEKYPDIIALSDVVLFFVDRFKFGLRLLQASENIKSQWKTFIQKSSLSRDGLVLFAEYFLKENNDIIFPENRLSPTTVTDQYSQ